MKVSIIIPYKDCRGFLAEAVESAEKQEGWKLGKDYEIIVQQGGGLGENINQAMKKAKGNYIKILADDDRLAPGCLEALYKFAVSGGYDFVCADAYLFEKYPKQMELSISTIPRSVRELAEHNTIHGGTILYKRAAFPVWDESHWTAEEYAVSLAMAAAGAKFGKLDEVVYWYRLHHRQKSLVYKSENGEMILKRYRYIRDYIQATYNNNHNKIVR